MKKIFFMLILLSIISFGQSVVKLGDYKIPVYIEATDATIGAVSIVIDYPKDLKVKEIKLAVAKEFYADNVKISKGQIRFGWFSLKGFKGGKFCDIVFEPKGFRFTGECEIADLNATPLPCEFINK